MTGNKSVIQPMTVFPKFRNSTLPLVQAAVWSPTNGNTYKDPQFAYISVMVPQFAVYAAQYFTATIYEWQPVLADDIHKDIIIDSLQFLVNDKRIELNAFVIMSNHIHLIWQALPGFTPPRVQASFMKYTAQQIKRSMLKTIPGTLSNIKVNKYNREYQIWKREPLGIELLNEVMFKQKLEYIHYNPVRAGLCAIAEEYHYSSAKFYYDGTNSFGMLKHYSGN